MVGKKIQIVMTMPSMQKSMMTDKITKTMMTKTPSHMDVAPWRYKWVGGLDISGQGFV